MPTLVRSFVDYDVDLLHIIAAQWDIDLTTNDRALAAEELAQGMAQPDAVRETWERLDADAQAALGELLANGGELPFAQFTRRFGELRAMGPARREREKPWLNPASITEALYYRGLIVRVFEQVPAGAQEFIAIPSELIDLLPQPPPRVEVRAPSYRVVPPRRLPDGHPTAPDDMATLLAFLLLREADAREWLDCRPHERIDRHLRRPEPAYRALLPQLAYDLGLIYAAPAPLHLTHVNRDAVRPWLEAPRSHQLRSLAETWLASTTWNDLVYTPGLEAEEWPSTPIAGRRVIVDMLGEVPPGEWWSVSGFVERVRELNPDFQRPGGDYAGWYLRDAYTGEILQGFESWDMVEGAMIRFIIQGPMHWLGLVRAGYGAFELTPFGLALQGRADWPLSPDREARARVDTQGLITVPVSASRYDRLQVARFAAWISAPPPSPYTPDGPSRDDAAYVYRLTPQAISRVVEEGVSIPSHIIPFLQRVTGHSLPPNVVKMLENWHEQPREVIVHDVVILSTRNLGAYQKIRANARVSRWLGKQIGPHAHIVKREDMPALLNALREMGVLPLFEGHEKDDSPL